MTTYTVIWKTTETAQLFTDEVVIDARLDEEIKELQNYEPLMMPIMIETAQDYLGFDEEDEEPLTAPEMAEHLMKDVRIVSIFCHEDKQLIDYADSLDDLITVFFKEAQVQNEFKAKKRDLHLVN
jgi:hypothetical protein